MTGSPYDAPLSALRDGVENLATALFIWEDRDPTRPDAMARRKASEAVAAADEMLRTLYLMRGRLVTQIREADAAAMTRSAAALEAARHAGEDGGA